MAEFTSSSWILESATLFYYTNPRVALGLSLGVAFLMYYLTTVAKRPTLVAKDGKFKDFLLQHCDIINERYWPTFWCFGTHAQTALANFVRSFLPDLPYYREILELSDGGLVSLDWLDSTPGEKDKKPVAIFMPGLTGHSQTEYVKSIVPVAYRQGCRCVVFNNRGRGGVELKTPKTYCALSTEDLTEVLEHIKKRYPSSPVVATGISLGGMILGHYLCQHGEKALVNAVLLISTVYDVHKGANNMETIGLNLMLNRHLARSLCNMVKPHKDKFPKELNMELVLKSRTIREFDEHFTSKLFGFSGAEDYYTMATLREKMSHIRVPTLCIAAADDMFAPLDALPIAEVTNSDHIALLITSRGGHIGFMEGLIPSLPFYSERLYEQYLRALMRLCDNGKISLDLEP